MLSFVMAGWHGMVDLFGSPLVFNAVSWPNKNLQAHSVPTCFKTELADKTWKQPKCPTTEEWIKKMWYICTMEYYSAIKKNEIMPFAATWMQIEIIILSEVTQKEKDKYHTTSLICGI